MYDPGYDKVVSNFAKKHSSFCESAKEFVKRVTKYKRIPATRALVVMISPEECSTKPYALAIQCIPYKSLKDSEVQQIANSIVKEMVSRKMKIAGITVCFCNVMVVFMCLHSKDLPQMVNGIVCAQKATLGLS